MHRTFRCWLCVLASSVLLLSLMHLAEGAPPPASADQYLVYIGTYTRGGESKGIYRLLLDVATGEMTQLGFEGGVQNPSFLAISPSQRFLYAVSEISDVNGKPTGGVAGFSIRPTDGELDPLNAQPSGSTGPCHLVVHPSEKCVLVANYAGGASAILPIDQDGKLGPPSVIQHQGSSVHPTRQTGPHAHSINLDSKGLRAYVPDLGLDKILIYQVDPAAPSLTINDPPFVAVDPGSGPRHFDFSPDGRFAYAICELGSTIVAFSHDPATGGLTPLQTVSTLPEGFSGDNSTADIHVHPTGKFLYGSNRGHDSIVVYAIDPASGQLTYVQHQSTLGQTPRNFGIDPGGRVLLAENQNSGTIHSFKIDPQSGALTPTGKSISIPRPVCAKFIPWGNAAR